MCLVSSDSLRGIFLQGMWTYDDPASLVILFFTHCATDLLSLTVLDYSIGIRLDVLRNDYLLVLRLKPSFRVVIARFCAREIHHTNDSHVM